jgi:hypothetical protein
MLMCRHDAQQNLVYREWQKSFGKVTALDLLETSTADFLLAGEERSIKSSVRFVISVVKRFLAHPFGPSDSF